MHTDTILKKYSSTVATIFTGIGSAALFGHTLTVNFILGISVVFISMHQVLQIISLFHEAPTTIIGNLLFDAIFSPVLFPSFESQR